MRISNDLLTKQAIEMVGRPHWDVFEWSVVRREPSIYKLTGAIAPLYKRGPKTGRRNWRKMFTETKQEVYITEAELHEWAAAWSERTGKCVRWRRSWLSTSTPGPAS